MKRTGLIVSMLLLCGAGAAVAQPAEALRSPWGERPVKVEAGSYACSLPGALPKDIVLSDYYSDAKHSVKDAKRYAAYQTASQPFGVTMKFAEEAAANFQSSGNRGAAECVLRLLDREAHTDAMTGSMSTNQAYYVQGWTVGALAVTWLKVRDAEPGTPEERSAVDDWLKQVAGSTKNYFTERAKKATNDGTNNHYYWAGLAVMAAGAAANDKEYFDWGVGTYDAGVGQIQPDGTLPREMARGQKALHYHLFALAPLVTMAEFGAANGMDLYGRDHEAMTRLIALSMAGLANNQYFAAKVGVAQDTPEKGKITSDEVIWIRPYLRRFPNADWSHILEAAPHKSYEYLGGMPPM